LSDAQRFGETSRDVGSDSFSISQMKSSKWIGWLHDRRVLSRRATTLAGLLAKVIPGNATVLDVGSGDGLVGYLIGQDRVDLQISGVDVSIRRDTHIPITQFDGKKLPFEDKTFDVCLFIDVLHHTSNQLDLLKEALRVSRRGLVIKDHLKEGFLSYSTLRFMDWIGNAHEGVALPYNYWTRGEWNAAFEALNLKAMEWKTDLGLYPWPASLVFGRGLHFIGYFTSRFHV
jgi:SAM-dependent methyltransferase